MCCSKFQHAVGACANGHVPKVSVLSGRALKQASSPLIPELGHDGKVHMESFLSLLHLHEGTASNQKQQYQRKEVARSSPRKPAAVDPDIVEDWQLLSLFRDL